MTDIIHPFSWFAREVNIAKPAVNGPEKRILLEEMNEQCRQ